MRIYELQEPLTRRDCEEGACEDDLTLTTTEIQQWRDDDALNVADHQAIADVHAGAIDRARGEFDNRECARSEHQSPRSNVRPQADDGAVPPHGDDVDCEPHSERVHTLARRDYEAMIRVEPVTTEQTATALPAGPTDFQPPGENGAACGDSQGAMRRVNGRQEMRLHAG